MYWVNRDGAGRWTMLNEGTKAEFEKFGPNHNAEPVSAAMAHKLVRGDLLPHNTALWVDDDGKIRRAAEGY